MKEHGILFTAPMVRALLAGRKTQTRRILKPQPRTMVDLGAFVECAFWDLKAVRDGDRHWALRSPHGPVGRRLWVRETWLPLDSDHMHDRRKPREAMLDLGPKVAPRRNGAAYAADETNEDEKRCRLDYGYKWRPSIHMPRWASRITLEGVRLERVQAISEDDARAEGMSLGEIPADDYGPTRVGDLPDRRREVSAASFCEEGVRDRVGHHQHQDGALVEQPWVWVYDFKRIS